MYYEGKIYRPWMEADSLLIQTTLGCTHNKCTFCDMFRDKKFRIRKIEDICRDIDEAKQIYPRVRSIFLIDGNVLALKTAFLLKILEKITATFPECSTIALYAGLNDLKRKSVEDLKKLKKAGLILKRKSISWKTWQVLRLFTGEITPTTSYPPKAHCLNPKRSFWEGSITPLPVILSRSRRFSRHLHGRRPACF